jgi:hypothetical protein
MITLFAEVDCRLSTNLSLLLPLGTSRHLLGIPVHMKTQRFPLSKNTFDYRPRQKHIALQGQVSFFGEFPLLAGFLFFYFAAMFAQGDVLLCIHHHMRAVV